jgi:hypothetical protein
MYKRLVKKREKKIINKILIFGIGILVGHLFIFLQGGLETKSWEERRDEILSEIGLALEEAKKLGIYNCCVEPSCEMCFLGEWIWEDGRCDCDTFVHAGEPDKACPECRERAEACPPIINETCPA